MNGPLQLTRAENLQAVSYFPNFAQLYQPVGTERIAVEDVQSSQVNDGILLLENVGEPALGEAAVQRHLATFEPAHHAVARNRPRAFVPAPGRLAAPRSHAAADAPFGMLLSSRRLQIAEVHNYSTTASRCGIFFTIPRKAGVSGRSTTWLI